MTSDVASRAEARRKAIMNRGRDRLAKLTTSARGDDAAYSSSGAEDPPLPEVPRAVSTSRAFLGDESFDMMPTPNRLSSTSPSPSSSPAPPRSQHPQQRSTRRVASDSEPGGSPTSSAATLLGSGPGPSAWSEDQQKQFLEALMGASPRSRTQSTEQGAPRPTLDNSTNPLAALFASQNQAGAGPPPENNFDNPFAALLGAAQAQSEGLGASQQQQQPLFPMQQQRERKPKSKLEKLLPVIHVVSTLALVVYFMFYSSASSSFSDLGELDKLERMEWWRKWAALAWRDPKMLVGIIPGGGGRTGLWPGTDIVPFFWAFTTLQLVLHSFRIFYSFDTPQPPFLLSLALPYLPPPFPAVITNALKYLQIGSLFLDDMAVAVVAMGALVYVSGWVGGGGDSLFATRG